MTTSENVREMMFSLRGQRIMVTGASSGIGRATSLALAALGAHVILVGRNAEKLDATASFLNAGASTVCPFDLRDAQSIGRWMIDLAGKLGPFSGLVHCAGDRRTLPIRAFSPSVFEESLRINTLATFALVAGFRSKLVCPDAGSIVIISSVAAVVGEGGMGFYCASKGAVSAAVKAWAIELASQKIRVNCIAPGLVQTDMMDQIKSSLTADKFKAVEGMHPLGLGRPEDVAGSAAFLLSGAARWITGTSLIVDGGYTAR